MSGARTSAGEWPSRGGDTLPCTALFIETRPFRGAPWAAFEPDDIQLWQPPQRDVEVFMQGLFGQGAFQGSTPSQAYFVKCDGETSTRLTSSAAWSTFSSASHRSSPRRLS